MRKLNKILKHQQDSSDPVYAMLQKEIAIRSEQLAKQSHLI